MAQVGDPGAVALSSAKMLQGRSSNVMRNPFDIDRAHLLDHVCVMLALLHCCCERELQLTRMRAYFLNPTQNESLGNEDLKHNTSIAAMGDYMTALRSRVVRLLLRL